MTSLHLAEASLASFSWLNTLGCVVVQKYQEMLFIHDYSHFFYSYSVNENTSSLKQIEQMGKCALNKYFYNLTINSQSKLKKFSTLFLKDLPGKTHYEIYKVSSSALWVGYPSNFHDSFFIKNYYLNLIFLSTIAECSNLKKNVSHLKLARYCKRQKKNTKKRERKTNYEKKSNNNNKYFWLIIFCFVLLFAS